MNAKKGEQSTFKRFIKENRTLALSFPILIVLVIAVIIIYSSMGMEIDNEAVPAAAEAADTKPQTIEVLPSTERELNSSGIPKAEVVERDPFSGPLTLVGVVVNSKGGNIVVIEANGKSYILKEDDVLENNLTVGLISTDQVVLKDRENNKEITLKLEKRSYGQPVIK